MLSEAAIRRMGWAASTIDERISLSCSPDDHAAGVVEARLSEWQRIATKNDQDLFRRRLETSGLDTASTYHIISDGCIPSDACSPSWAGCLSWIVEALCIDLGESASNDDQHPLPFQDLFSGLIAEASRRADLQLRMTGIEPSVAVSLERLLLSRLTSVCASPLYEHFTLFRTFRSLEDRVEHPIPAFGTASNSLYCAWLTSLREGEVKSFLSERPVLGRLLAAITSAWMKNASDFLIRFQDDKPILDQEFGGADQLGTLICVEGGYSDPHNHGQVVLKLQFTSGKQLAYKPRSLSIDLAWRAFIGWLEDNGAPKSCGIPHTVDRGQYGWVEWINPAEPAASFTDPEFYERAGALLCLFVGLGGTDFHADNIVRVEGTPYPVDLETLFHPWRPSLSAAIYKQKSLGAAAEMLKSSVLATYYLPSWTLRPDEDLIRSGGLNEALVLRDERTYFTHVNTDRMHPERVSRPYYTPESTGEDHAITASFSQQARHVKSGFERMYKFLCSNKDTILSPGGALEYFCGLTIRFIHRPTQLYALLLDRSLRGHTLSSGFRWSLNFETLSRYLDESSHSEKCEWLILAAERKSLQSLDIPYFSARTDSLNLYIQGGQAIQNYFHTTSFERQKERIFAFSDADLQMQLEFIDWAFSSSFKERQHKKARWPQCPTAHPSEPLTRKEAIQTCRALATSLFERAVLRDGEAAWIGAVPIPSADHFAQLEVAGHGLYAGGSGIALFLSALFAATGDERYRELCLAAFRCIQSDLRQNPKAFRLTPIGAGVGLGSIIYGLTRAAKLVEEPSLYSDALQLADFVTEDRISQDRNYDVISGAGGGILGLLALFDATQVSWVLQRALACGYHLVANQRKASGGGCAWVTSRGVMLTGMSHGAAGIALSLERLAKATNDQAFRRAAASAIEYERSTFSQDYQDWPDLRFDFRATPPMFACQWCHGAPGIGLSRLDFLGGDDDKTVHAEISAAVRATLAFEFGENDDVCCGNFGRLSFLFSAGQRLGRKDLTADALRMAGVLRHSAKGGGDFRWRTGLRVLNPGFYTGVSGVCYELLRITAPGSLPSVLNWD